MSAGAQRGIHYQKLHLPPWFGPRLSVPCVARRQKPRSAPNYERDDERDRSCAPMFLIARQAPSAVAQGRGQHLRVAVAAPTFPDQVETMDIYLTGDFRQAGHDDVREISAVAAQRRGLAGRTRGSTSAMRRSGSGGTSLARCSPPRSVRDASRTCAAILSGAGIWMRSLSRPTASSAKQGNADSTPPRWRLPAANRSRI